MKIMNKLKGIEKARCDFYEKTMDIALGAAEKLGNGGIIKMALGSTAFMVNSLVCALVLSVPIGLAYDVYHVIKKNK